MIKISGDVNVKISATIEEAIEKIYQDCIAKAEKETDKTDERFDGMIKAIDCLRKNYVAVTNSTNNERLDRIVINGILSIRTHSDESSFELYTDSINLLKALNEKFFYYCNTKTLNELKSNCYDPCLKSIDSEYVEKAKEVSLAMGYLLKNYPNYIKGISLEEQNKKEEDQKDEIEFNMEINSALIRGNNLHNEEFPSYIIRGKTKSILSILKPKRKEVEKTLNYWELLKTPEYSSLKSIKASYIVANDNAEETKRIGNQLFRDLIELNVALDTLSNPYLRYVHNCQIHGLEAISYEAYIASNEFETIEDFGPKANEKVLKYIEKKLRKYKSINPETCDKHIDIELLKKLIDILEHNYEELSKKISEQIAVKHTL